MINLKEERKIWKKGYKNVVGLDEAGRGPLAGPVVAGAAMIKFTNFQFPIFNKFSIFNFQELKKIRDSKKLTAKQREEFFKILTNHHQIKWGIGVVSEKIIDKVNIKNAAELAMFRAVKKLKVSPHFLIIDGKYLKNKNLKKMNYKMIVRGDEKVFSCACASIIAKVTRDRIMAKYHRKYPQYDFLANKGYSTKKHFEKLEKIGPCAIHRKSFRPVSNFFSIADVGGFAADGAPPATLRKRACSRSDAGGS